MRKKPNIPFDDINEFFHRDAKKRGLSAPNVGLGTSTGRAMVYRYWEGKVIVSMTFVLNYAKFVGVSRSQIFRMLADAIDEADQEKKAEEKKVNKGKKKT